MHCVYLKFAPLAKTTSAHIAYKAIFDVITMSALMCIHSSDSRRNEATDITSLRAVNMAWIHMFSHADQIFIPAKIGWWMSLRQKWMNAHFTIFGKYHTANFRDDHAPVPSESYAWHCSVKPCRTTHISRCTCFHEVLECDGREKSLQTFSCNADTLCVRDEMQSERPTLVAVQNSRNTLALYIWIPWYRAFAWCADPDVYMS